MASVDAVTVALKSLGRAFAGTVDAERIALYYAALDDIEDADLLRATAALIKTHTGEFIPPPSHIRRAAGANRPVAVDVAAVTRAIEKLGIYNPNVGMIYPDIGAVRERLGDAIAYAYASAGGTRLFADNDTTRDIATREFANAIADAANRPGAFPILGSVNPMPLLSAPADAPEDP